MRWLITTGTLGVVFLVVKYFEYAEKFEHHLVPLGVPIVFNLPRELRGGATAA